MIYLLGCHELALCFASLHEVDVVLEEGCVEDALYSVFMTYVGDCEHVLEGHRLSSDEVRTCLHTHERNFFRTILLDGLPQFPKIKVSLERLVRNRHKTLLSEHFDNFSAESGDMSLCGGEVEVHDRDHSRLHICLSQDVLCRTALMGRKHMLGAEDLEDCGLDPVEGLRTRIRVIGHAH